jgi:hypothetical protein
MRFKSEHLTLAASFLVVVTVRIWWVQAFQRREAFAMS